MTYDFKLTKKYRIFKKILSILDVSPEEILHIGDHYVCDYETPKSIGINAYYIDRTNKTNKMKSDEVIYDLNELLRRAKL